MSVELKPCPWCGDSLKVVRVVEGDTFRWRRVQGCCADGPEVRHDTLAENQAAAHEDSERRAIEAWNTRASQGAAAGVPAGLIESLRHARCGVATERRSGAVSKPLSELAADAREALDSMDDFARMDVGVDAHGPRGVLDRFIAAAKDTEIEALRAEVERLTGCLATANANHEQFERQWYLERDRAERLEEALRAALAQDRASNNM